MAEVKINPEPVTPVTVILHIQVMSRKIKGQPLHRLAPHPEDQVTVFITAMVKQISNIIIIKFLIIDKVIFSPFRRFGPGQAEFPVNIF